MLHMHSTCVIPTHSLPVHRSLLCPRKESSSPLHWPISSDAAWSPMCNRLSRRIQRCTRMAMPWKSASGVLTDRSATLRVPRSFCFVCFRGYEQGNAHRYRIRACCLPNCFGLGLRSKTLPPPNEDPGCMGGGVKTCRFPRCKQQIFWNFVLFPPRQKCCKSEMSGALLGPFWTSSASHRVFFSHFC